jgi:hypothetical protein
MFTFHPERVPSFPIDPLTNLPPDVGPDGQAQPVDPEALARAVRQPVCEVCLGRFNARREAEGQEPIQALPGAYEAAEVGSW